MPIHLIGKATRLLPTLVFAAVLLGGAAAEVRSDTVVFENGRRIRVQSYRIEGGRVTLVLRNGGVMRVERSLIAAFLEDPETPEKPVDRPAGAEKDAAGETRPVRVPEQYAPLIRQAASKHGLDECLLVAVIQAESSFDPRAVSPKGAVGLMQLMPATAERFGVSDPFDPRQNLHGGAAYLKLLLERFDGDLRMALAAYNAGEGRVEAHNGVPPFHETVQYVSRVISHYRALRDG